MQRAISLTEYLPGTPSKLRAFLERVEHVAFEHNFAAQILHVLFPSLDPDSRTAFMTACVASTSCAPLRTWRSCKP